MSTDPRQERTLGQLVASATQDISTLVRSEIALAKAEVSVQVKKAGVGGGLLAGAAVVVFYSVYFLFTTIAEGIQALGVPRWLSFLIVTVFMLLVAAVLGLARRPQDEDGQPDPGEDDRRGAGDRRRPQVREPSTRAPPSRRRVPSWDRRDLPAAPAGTVVRDRCHLPAAPAPARRSRSDADLTRRATPDPRLAAAPMSVDASFVNIDGPWEHRYVSANGARFHVAELGDGPLVLMLHGFPQFWYAWRHQMVALADAGYRVAAMDLRGYGGSDKPPRGYDTYTATLDAASVIRALGEKDAVVLGQGLGGWIAWCMPVLRPDVTRAIASLSMPHPRIMRHATWSNPRQRRASAWIAGLQKPFRPRTRDGAVARLRRGLLPLVGIPRRHLSRRRGRLPLRRRHDDPLRGPLGRGALPLARAAPRCAPTARSSCAASVMPSACRCCSSRAATTGASSRQATHGSGAFVPGDYRQVKIDGAGHFLTEEAPDRVSGALVKWLGSLA